MGAGDREVTGLVDQAKVELYPAFDHDEIDFPALGPGTGEAIALEDIDFGDYH